MRSNPSDYKERCARDVLYLKNNIEDRISRDHTARNVWWEKLDWLKDNAWWSYMIIKRWINDYDYERAMNGGFGSLEWIEWKRSGSRGRLARKGKHPLQHGSLGGEAAPREKAELGNDSQEVNDCQ